MNLRQNILIASVLAVCTFAYISICNAAKLPNIPEITISKAKVSSVIHVDNLSSNASDQNPGTESRPLKTISKAVEIAEQNKKRGIGVKVLIYPGVYREQIDLRLSKKGIDTDASLVIEAKEKGTVQVNGSDIWTDWKASSKPGVYVHDWPYDWGLSRDTSANLGAEMKEHMRHREIIFIDDKPLRQVLRKKLLEPGTFYVSEPEDSIYLQLRPLENIADVKIEVGIRDNLIIAHHRKNLVIRGLDFCKAGNYPMHNYAMSIAGGENLLIEDCSISWNNGGSFAVFYCSNTIMRRCVANYNGYSANLGFLENCLFEDIETSYNNWRGAWARYYSWSVAGIKAMPIHSTIFRNHRAIGNECAALWFDSDVKDIVVEDSFYADNRLQGIILENVQGPVLIKNTVMCFNEYGIGFSKAGDVTFEGNVVYGNKSGQIAIDNSEKAVISGLWTQDKITSRNENIVFRDNVIVSTTEQSHWLSSKSPLIEVPNRLFFLSTFSSDKNLFYHPEPDRAFKIGAVGAKQGYEGVSFMEWRITTGQDHNSLFADPKYIDASNKVFIPRNNSPLNDRASWSEFQVSDDNILTVELKKIANSIKDQKEKR